MLNAEKYKKRIEELDYRFALCNGELQRCKGVRCDECAFYESSCSCMKYINKWLLEEYKEPILSQEGKEFLKQLIAPFKSNEIVSVCKNEDLQILRIDYKIGWTCYSKKVLGEKWDWFKNLNPEKLYTLDELGL